MHWWRKDEAEDDFPWQSKKDSEEEEAESEATVAEDVKKQHMERR